MDDNVQLPSGYSLTWGGQFKNLQDATGRLAIAVPVALLLILALLFITFNSARLTVLIFLNVPIAATGGVFALWIAGLPFSISAGVGFIALFGIAVLNGVVLVNYIVELRQQGSTINDAVFDGAMTRLRPVLMTALTTGLGLLPRAISTGTGAEGPATGCHRRYRRPDHLDATHPHCRTGHLSVLRTEVVGFEETGDGEGEPDIARNARSRATSPATRNRPCSER